jgi:elongation factor Ts
MAAISAGLVKQLRDQTGAGMMDCKQALSATDGDLEAATDWLRKKGLAAAAKRAGRETQEGVVGLVVEGSRGAMIELNSETDFVARNDTFQELALAVCHLALEAGGDLEALRGATMPASGRSVADEITQAVGVIGENIHLRRTAALFVGQGIVAGYLHAQLRPGLGRIGVLVALESTAEPARLEELGKQLAMHIAATRPQAVTAEQLDPTLIARERAIYADQARGTGKPDAIVEKIVDGRIRKFYEEVVLLEQVFVIDTEQTVKEAIARAAEAAGAPIEVKGFERFALGEGAGPAAGDA